MTGLFQIDPDSSVYASDSGAVEEIVAGVAGASNSDVAFVVVVGAAVVVVVVGRTVPITAEGMVTAGLLIPRAPAGISMSPELPDAGIASPSSAPKSGCGVSNIEIRDGEVVAVEAPESLFSSAEPSSVRLPVPLSSTATKPEVVAVVDVVVVMGTVVVVVCATVVVVAAVVVVVGASVVVGAAVVVVGASVVVVGAVVVVVGAAVVVVVDAAVVVVVVGAAVVDEGVDDELVVEPSW